MILAVRCIVFPHQFLVLCTPICCGSLVLGRLGVGVPSERLGYRLGKVR